MFYGYKKGPYSPIQSAYHLCDSSAPTVYTLFCNPVGPGQFFALPSECLALWQRQQLNVSVCHASPVVDMLHAQVTTCQHVLPLLKAMHHICLFSWYYTYSILLHQLAVDFHWCNTHHTKIKTHFILQSLPWFWKTIFNLTYLWYPLIAAQWHSPHVPITCLTLQSHDTISCQTCCYLIFWNFLVYLSEVENSKYGTRNTSTTGSTTGMNKDMPLILNNKSCHLCNWWGTRNNLFL